MKYNIVPIILAVITLGGGFYNEKWIFDKQKNIIEYQIGLLIIYKKVTYRLSEFEQIELMSFYKGSNFNKTKKEDDKYKLKARKKMIIFQIIDKAGFKYKIDTASAIHLKEMENNVQILSQFCNIPYSIEK